VRSCCSCDRFTIYLKTARPCKQGAALYVLAPRTVQHAYSSRACMAFDQSSLPGMGPSITSEAVRWCALEAVAVYLMERSAECVAVVAAAAETDGRRRALAIRERQFAAVLDPRKRLEIAGKIVAAKLRTLSLDPVDAREFRAEITAACKIEDLMVAEARAGAAFFMRYRGTEIRFKDAVPDRWRVFAARAGTTLKGRGGTSKARHAATPIGAMLNYAFTVALGQVTRACVGVGLDSMFGYPHSPKPGRPSLSYDVLELHRAAITEAIFGLSAKHAFAREDFETDRYGVVRLSGPVAREIAAQTLKTAPMAECVKSVRKMAGWF
jgi:CRISP-associated protein Cas1